MSAVPDGLRERAEALRGPATASQRDAQPLGMRDLAREINGSWHEHWSGVRPNADDKTRWTVVTPAAGKAAK